MRSIARYLRLSCDLGRRPNDTHQLRAQRPPIRILRSAVGHRWPVSGRSSGRAAPDSCMRGLGSEVIGRRAALPRVGQGASCTLGAAAQAPRAAHAEHRARGKVGNAPLDDAVPARGALKIFGAPRARHGAMKATHGIGSCRPDLRPLAHVTEIGSRFLLLDQCHFP